MNPLYKMIHDDLRELVENQTYHDGETIPSEEELASAYGVSRPTVRRAIQMLMDEGVLEKGAHRGICVNLFLDGFCEWFRRWRRMRMLTRSPCIIGAAADG